MLGLREDEGHVKHEEEPVREIGEGDEVSAVRSDAESVEAEVEVIQVDSDSCTANLANLARLLCSCSVELICNMF